LGGEVNAFLVKIFGRSLAYGDAAFGASIIFTVLLDEEVEADFAKEVEEEDEIAVKAIGFPVEVEVEAVEVFSEG